jgi:hypothetical protein
MFFFGKDKPFFFLRNSRFYPPLRWINRVRQRRQHHVDSYILLKLKGGWHDPPEPPGTEL